MKRYNLILLGLSFLAGCGEMAIAQRPAATVYTYSITPEMGSLDAIQAAIDYWIIYCPLLQEAAPDEQADIEFMPSDFGGNSRIGGFADFWGEHNYAQQDVYCTVYYQEFESKMESIITHELGHCLRLIKHSPNPDNIMFKDYTENGEVTEAQIQTVCSSSIN